MKRKIVNIDEAKCNGCGLCVPNCAEGAIQIVDGKARLVADVYCDGLGACLGHCPEGAITIEERDTVEFDESAVKKHLASMGRPAPAPHAHSAVPASHARQTPHHHGGGCPGSALRSFARPERSAPKPADGSQPAQESCLSQWPVQLMLVPPQAPFLKGADLLLCADCAPFAIPDFHTRYLAGRAVVVGCPKLDDLEYYREKLIDLFKEAQPSKITVLRMEVPCCGGLAHIALEARNLSAPQTPLEVHVVGIGGGIEVESHE